MALRRMRGIRVADAAQHVVVVLEHVRVDRAQGDPKVVRRGGQRGVVVDLVPRDVQRDRRRDARVAVDLGGVGDLLVRIAGHARLREHLEARAGVAEGPRRQLDAERTQARHHGLSGLGDRLHGVGASWGRCRERVPTSMPRVSDSFNLLVDISFGIPVPCQLVTPRSTLPHPKGSC